MSRAVCRKCGTENIGALGPCLRCQFLPQTPEEQAKSLLLSDHYRTSEELRQAAKQIRNGEPLTFDDAQVRQLREAIEAMPAPLVSLEPPKPFKLAWLILALFVGALTALFWRVLAP